MHSIDELLDGVSFATPMDAALLRTRLAPLIQLLGKYEETLQAATARVERLEQAEARLTQIRESAQDAPYYGREWVRIGRALITGE